MKGTHDTLNCGTLSCTSKFKRESIDLGQEYPQKQQETIDRIRQLSAKTYVYHLPKTNQLSWIASYVYIITNASSHLCIGQSCPSLPPLLNWNQYAMEVVELCINIQQVKVKQVAYPQRSHRSAVDPERSSHPGLHCAELLVPHLAFQQDLRLPSTAMPLCKISSCNIFQGQHPRFCSPNISANSTSTSR